MPTLTAYECRLRVFVHPAHEHMQEAAFPALEPLAPHLNMVTLNTRTLTADTLTAMARAFNNVHDLSMGHDFKVRTALQYMPLACSHC